MVRHFLDIHRLEASELRAILEPGYVAPKRDPLHYGPEADHERA